MWTNAYVRHLFVTKMLNVAMLTVPLYVSVCLDSPETDTIAQLQKVKFAFQLRISPLQRIFYEIRKCDMNYICMHWAANAFVRK